VTYNINFHVFFDYTAAWKNLLFVFTDCLVMQDWGIGRKPIDRRFQKYNFQTVVNSSFCYKEPWNSIEHNIRKSIILTFTSFSITQLEKLAFYVHGLSSYARMRHRQKAYVLRRKFKFLLQGPWNSIEHKIRKSIILTFSVLMRIPFFGVSWARSYMHILGVWLKSISDFTTLFSHGGLWLKSISDFTILFSHGCVMVV
jgi:hypothetical protein